jgi:imidazolonepropionase-like amidohydrolase
MTWIVNGNLIDVRTGRIERRHLQIDDGRITVIAASLPAKAGEDAIDVAGAYLLPGFFDCHVHICVDTHNLNVAEGWSNALPGTIALYAAQAARRMLMAGFPTLEAIQAATTGGAAMMRLDRDLGSLEPGKIADVIATRSNPAR